MALAIDLFCGAGGMSEGLLQAGFHIVYSSDISVDVEKTYTNRHKQLGYIQGKNTHFERADIKDIKSSSIIEAINSLEVFKDNPPVEIDAIFGGPPCQGFSRSGRRDPNDPRNLLFKEYLRVVNDIRPKYVVMENVEGFMDTKMPGFKGVNGKEYPENTLMPEILISEFDDIGYNTLTPSILNAAQYGVPQKRPRAIFIAYRKGELEPRYPEPIYTEENQISIEQAISDLVSSEEGKINQNKQLSSFIKDSINGRTPNVDGITIPSKGAIFNHELSKHSSIIKERFSLFREGERTPNLYNRIKNNGLDLSQYPQLKSLLVKQTKKSEDELIQIFQSPPISDTLLEILLTKKNNRTRLVRSEPSPTVVTLPDDYITPYENRIPSVRELARLQSFDDSFVFLGKRTTGGDRRKVEVPQYTQVGNAVPPLLAKAIGMEIMRVLQKTTINNI